MIKRLFGKQQEKTSGKLVFISHCHDDKILSDRFVQLLQGALLISRNDIHCTSVPGCTPDPSSDIATVSIEEACKAKIFVVLLTPSSLVSRYVWAEVGARLGAGKKVVPLALNESVAKTAGPIHEKLALHASTRTDVQKLLEEIRKESFKTLEVPSAFDSAINELVETAKEIALQRQFPKTLTDLISAGPDGGCYVISKKSRLFLTAEGQSRRIVQQIPGASDIQRWRFEPLSNDAKIAKIVPVARPEKCIGTAGNDSDIFLDQFQNSESQKWELKTFPDGSVMVKAADGKACLDVEGGRTTVGTRIIRHSHLHEEDNQKWILFPFCLSL